MKESETYNTVLTSSAEKDTHKNYMIIWYNKKIVESMKLIEGKFRARILARQTLGPDEFEKLYKQPKQESEAYKNRKNNMVQQNQYAISNASR